MCLALVAIDAHSRYRCVIVANRDEFHARPAAPATWGQEAPFIGILAGRDIQAGGTWLGVAASGRFALLTNVREPDRRMVGAPSRGKLVPRALDAALSPAQALAAVAADAGGYNGFNLLCGDAHRATWMSNRAASSLPIERGIHGLSNALLNTPWPKLTRTRAAFAKWAARGETSLQPLLALLADRTIASDSTLPATGVDLEQERLLSAPFIVSEGYGTRCSTVVAIDRDGNAQFNERSFDQRGAATGEVEFTFTLDAGARQPSATTTPSSDAEFPPR